MELFEIQYKKSIENDLKKVDKKYIPKILKLVESLATNPLQSQSKKLKNTENFYGIRVGQYRLIYQIQMRNHLIIIYYIRHRKHSYKSINF
jgi:mRNA interferase RelE/StbE